ncbi:MAG TPA: M20/M25/M40 family metallo-hydrolase [bacterium]|nr:M20/M25/M40 family metallo-hydrolase [bacterium]
MKSWRIFASIFLLSIYCQITIAKPPEDISVENLRAHISFLASDSLKGRKPGTPEGKIAAQYIREQLISSGFELLGDNGFQYLEAISDIQTGPNNKLILSNYQGEPGVDFTPLSFSRNDSLSATVAFAGYGFDINSDSLVWNDYQQLDVVGKWCLILKGDPDPDKNDNSFAPFSSLRKKVLTAKDHGAKGVLFVSGEKFDAKDELIDLFYDRSESDAGILVFQLKRTLADQILAPSGKTIVALEQQINESRTPIGFVVESKVTGAADIIKNKVKTQNVVAILRGADPVFNSEYLVIGAHYDHLGFGGPGSGSRRPDTLAIHNGADDNASGVAAILEIAKKVAAYRKEMKRSVIMIAFAAEEMGTLGSKYFTNNPLVDLKQIQFMFNLDMVGRLESLREGLTVGGTGTAVGLNEMVEKIAKAHSLPIKTSPEGYGPSDHANFYIHDIPVLMFFTGAHEFYHTPDDDIEYVNMDGVKIIADFVYELAVEIINQPQKLAFQEAGPKVRQTTRRRFKVTLGIMPDHAAADVKGMRVDLVIKDRPAALAGMEKGDVIVAMEGKPVNDIYEYMNRLAEFKVGQRISVEVLRDGEKKILIVQL